MFGLGFGEIILILAIALVVVGPKKLPEIAKGLGKGYGEFRKYMNEFKDAVNVGIDEVDKPKPTAAQKVYEEHYKDTVKDEPSEVKAQSVTVDAEPVKTQEKKQDA
ncbi:Sec-independent protein translocase subunit TatA/TatB [Seleniivibrio woodruffii]|uniref:Sec-independent protein translocase protein TatA n=1 Tax=Seleniivibrio woodruffii TaxID=1078050 RepID=A0A4R1K683_9BACT|nr:twin-arginine translocase TatA/TatE family subunit [Seleniivibrio woodruffii]TCK59480.1 sec-independent protein translocase protein TatA/sec-independent protein translocase protein TatB [Seleniivibrio woodruffii]TVZ35479.1 sec-independent protein translocase protein TatA/sec-independent protein translocase protein TatB [Seleniivibrio woodruffii]